MDALKVCLDAFRIFEKKMNGLKVKKNKLGQFTQQLLAEEPKINAGMSKSTRLPCRETLWLEVVPYENTVFTTSLVTSQNRTNRKVIFIIVYCICILY